MVSELRLTCTARRPEAPGVVTFTLRPDGGARLGHLPGQALTLGLPAAGGEEPLLWRTFTIASAPQAAAIEVTVKAPADGVGTRWLHERLLPGMTVAARGPVGQFSIARHHGPRFALVSGGSGATPMMSMLRWLAARGETVEVAYIHAARTPRDVLFASELSRLDAAMPNLRVATIVSTVPPGESWTGFAGRLDRRLMSAVLPDFARREVFCCGPAGFMAAVERIFRAEGGDPGRFHTESFGTAASRTAGTAASSEAAPSEVAVTLSIAGRSIPARKGDLVLAAARAGGVTIPTGCGEGLCGTCRIRATAGTAAMSHKGGLSRREERQGYLLACCSRLTGDLRVEIPGHRPLAP